MREKGATAVLNLAQRMNRPTRKSDEPKQKGASDCCVGTACGCEWPQAEARRWFAPLSHEMGEGPGERAGAQGDVQWSSFFGQADRLFCCRRGLVSGRRNIAKG